MSRANLSLVGLVAADAAALVVLFPGVRFAAQLAAPRAWLAQVGADGAAAELAAAGLWLAAAWLALGLGAAVAGALPGAVGRAADELAQRVLPRAVLRLVAGAAGLGVLIAPIAATADARPTTSTTAPGWPTSAPPAAPAWPVTPPAPSGSHPTGSHARPPTAHRSPSRPASEPGLVVAPGDTLWSIAADHLPAGRRTPARIAAAWPRWYAANRAVIGADPDHIEAGQVLHLPTSGNRAREAGS